MPASVSFLTHLLGRHEGPEAERARLAQAMAAASPLARVITHQDAARPPVAYNAAYARLCRSLGHEAPVTPLMLCAPAPAMQQKLARLARRLPPDDVLREEVLLGGMALGVSLLVRPDEPAELIWDFADRSGAHEAVTQVTRQRDDLAAFIDQAPVGLYALSPDGRLLFANQTFADWLGTTPQALLADGPPLAGLLQPADPAAPPPGPAWEGGEARLLRPGTGGAPDADAPARLVAVSQTPLKDETGAVIRISAVVHDISRELRMRGTMRPVDTEFQRFFDQAPIGILVLDAVGSIIEGNAAFGILCGRQDWPGQRLAALVREEDGLMLNRYLMAVRRGQAVTRPLDVGFPGDARAGGETRGGELRGRTAQVFAASLAAGADSQAAQLVYLVDTTEQRSLQAQFNQSQKMQAVGQLAGGIAHDFNNLLTAMIGFCDLLLQRHQPGDQSFADVMQVKQNANRAANLVRQLLAFSRQQTLVPRVLDVTDVLADLRNLIGRLIGETITLSMSHGRDLGLVKVDQGQLEQVIINLAVNARDAMLGPSGMGRGELRIRTADWKLERAQNVNGEIMPAGDYVLIEVGDTGHGIAPENIAKIFDPFFTTKAVGAGTGLGLSTVYGIIKQTGGFIQVESAPGQGATFRIFLPRHQPSAAELAQAAQPRDGVRADAPDLTGQGLVLLVEDEDAVRAFAVRALRNKGYTVIEANSGEQALSLPDDQLDRVDVLISDVVMPNMDGPTLAEHLRQRRPGLKILFISGYAEDSLRQSMTRTDGVSFLPKPFSLGQLAQRLKDIMDQPG